VCKGPLLHALRQADRIGVVLRFGIFRFSRPGFSPHRLPSSVAVDVPIPTARPGRMKTFFLAIVLMLPACVFACGGSSSNQNTTSKAGDVGSDKPAGNGAAGAETPPVAAEKVAIEFPTACTKGGGDVCVPPVAFAKHVCSAPNASALALALFAKGGPWQRMYLARDTEAWDASGSAAGSTSTKLAYDEEVLVLAFRPPANTGGMVVSGANGAYDVLRWDGVCASLNADELRKWLPPEPGYASIPWRKLDDDTQQKLLADGRISLKEGEMKKACKGLSASQTNPACDKARKSLSKAVVSYVRAGGAVPTPKVP
jgi:hypothetical protein